MNVYVVTCPELGWDCVVGVFAEGAVTYEELRKRFPIDQYVIHEENPVETNLSNWEY